MEFHKYIISLLVITACTSLSGQTNEGTEFWFSFMEHRNPRVNTKVVMITSRVNTRGVVSAPLAGYAQPFTVNANDVTIIELPEYAETFGSESISDNGFRVTSDDLISVYIHQYHEFRAEATVVLPKSTIDNSYYALSYSGYFTEGEHFPSEMLLVATEDETTISIRLSANTRGGRTRGSTFSIVLNAGETYQIQGGSQTDDLSGTYVEGDENFSLFCGNRYSALNCFRSGRDNLLEQAFPISTWGTRFVSAPFQVGLPDVFRILASEDDTEVTVYFEDATETNYNIDAGRFIEYDDSRVSFVESTEPILIAQYINQLDCGNGSTGDPSMLYLNSVLQIRDTVTLYNSSFQNIRENYINIITRSSDTSNVYFDGQPITDLSSSLTLAGRDDEYASITLRVSTGAHTIASAGCGVIAKSYGLGIYESYAYSGGASFNRINASPIPDGGCLNDTVFFDTGLPEERFAVKWVLEGEDTIATHQFEKIYTSLGSFGAELFIHDMCFDLFDTLSKDLSITIRQSVDTDAQDFICEGGEIQLSATDVSMARYEWRGPQNYFSEEQFPILSNVQPSISGTYEVIGIVSGCATLPALVEVDVKPSPVPNLGQDAVFCPKSEVETLAHPGQFESYLWEDGSESSSLTISAEGTYTVTVTDEFGCSAIDSITFDQQCPTVFYVPNVFSPNGDLVNDHTGVFGEDIISIDFRIYDRWGSELFKTSDMNAQWDGKYNGRYVLPGAYVWILELAGYEEDGSQFQKIHRGTLTVIR